MASKYYLVIYGDRFQAARAAADRGIPFAFKSQTIIRTNNGVSARCSGFVSSQFVDKIGAWYGELNTAADAAKIGALLSYHSC